jgi:hypothetical protein
VCHQHIIDLASAESGGGAACTCAVCEVAARLQLLHEEGVPVGDEQERQHAEQQVARNVRHADVEEAARAVRVACRQPARHARCIDAAQKGVRVT